MKKVAQGEQVSRTKRVDGEQVIIHHVTEHKTGRYETTWKFDYTGVSRQELMLQAARQHVIDQRPLFKKAKESELQEWDNKVFSIREYLDAERRTADPVARVKKGLDKLTEDERKQLLAELMKEGEN
jgi:hypothetical protein